MPKLLLSERWKYVVSDLNNFRSTKSGLQYFIRKFVEITTVRTLAVCNFDFIVRVNKYYLDFTGTITIRTLAVYSFGFTNLDGIKSV
jgi:hypothetical protein